MPIPGKCLLDDCSEWTLNRYFFFKKQSERFFEPKWFLFASTLSTYIFSPFSQVAKVFQKIEDEQVTKVHCRQLKNGFPD